MEARILILALLIWVSACTKEEAKPTATGIIPPPQPKFKITITGYHMKPQFAILDSDYYAIGFDTKKVTNNCYDFTGATLPYTQSVWTKNANIYFYFTYQTQVKTTECNWTDSSYLVLNVTRYDTAYVINDTFNLKKHHNWGTINIGLN